MSSNNIDCSLQSRFGSLGRTCAFFGATFLGISAAQATILTVGSNVFSVGSAYPTGGVVVASQSQPCASATYSGTLTSTVIAGAPSPELGGLAFLSLLTSTTQEHYIVEAI